MATLTKAQKKRGVHLYRDAGGEWRWRLVVNGRITADGAEGYTTRAGGARAVRAFFRTMWSLSGVFHEDGVA